MAPEEPKLRRTAADWEERYVDGDTPWDTGMVDPALRELVEAGCLKPCRAIEFGCGTGTNAVYLAQHGFAVTGVDYSQLAIEQARHKAAAAGVAIAWQAGDLAEFAAPAEPFELLFDRGCYHCMRRAGLLAAYQAAVGRLLTSGARIVILAGNSDDTQEGGPPKVSAADLCGDFQKLCRIESLAAHRFEDLGGKPGPLAWKLVMTRR
ncbi:MAG: hypothetical protein C0483_06365 [Pirellula sp.]|nr:hypothetical protein [Pirellula sp.]